MEECHVRKKTLEAETHSHWSKGWMNYYKRMPDYLKRLRGTNAELSEENGGLRETNTELSEENA